MLQMLNKYKLCGKMIIIIPEENSQQSYILPFGWIKMKEKG